MNRLIPAQIKRPNPLAYAFAGMVVLALGIASSLYVYVMVDKTGRAHIVDRVQTIAQALPAESLKAIAARPGSEQLSDYVAVKDLLIRMRAANHDARFIYVVGAHSDQTLYFLADSEVSGSPEYSPPGQDYPEATALMKDVFTRGISGTEGPDRDRWGVWISGYAPVYDTAGRVVALVGIDIPAVEFILTTAAYALLPLLIALVFLVFVTSAERIHAREYRAVAQKAEFLSIASHEIRTPLTGIRWAVETLLTTKRSPVPQELRPMLEQVHENTIMLIARINNLLDVTAFETRAGGVLHKSRFAARPFIQGIAESLKLSAAQRRVTIRIDDSVTDAGEITADQQTMHHVFFNLLANAVKYTKEDTEVSVSYRGLPRMHEFAIADEGPGMTVTDARHVFDGYHRTEEAVRSGQYGSGLGLYLVRTAIELHGGTVRVESALGAGSKFILTLPKKA